MINKVHEPFRGQLADMASAEIGGLVHVHPKAIKLDMLVKISDLILPPALAFLAQEVREVHGPWPHLRNRQRLSHVSCRACKRGLIQGPIERDTQMPTSPM